jgi:hypothetical protein
MPGTGSPTLQGLFIILSFHHTTFGYTDILFDRFRLSFISLFIYSLSYIYSNHSSLPLSVVPFAPTESECFSYTFLVSCYSCIYYFYRSFINYNRFVKSCTNTVVPFAPTETLLTTTDKVCAAVPLGASSVSLLRILFQVILGFVLIPGLKVTL